MRFAIKFGSIVKEIRYGEKTRYEEICKKALPRVYNKQGMPIFARQMVDLRGECKMSQLLGIIQRLHAMQEDESAETQARRFEKNGTPVCEVKFFQASNSFEVEIYGDNSKYQFDDIDMTAIEIFETLQENE